MEVTKDKNSNTCDDCGQRYSDNGFIIKSEKKQIRIHLCQNCLKKLMNGQFTRGYNMKPSKSKLIKDYDHNITLDSANRTPQSLSNIAFNFSESYRQKYFPHIKNIGYENAALAVMEIIAKSKCSGEELAKALNKSEIGYKNWKLYDEDTTHIRIFCVDKLGNKYILTVNFK